ncbi:hypothetical protein [Cribrihabitans pelagius]|uniref:hypothetical protein n=1 Tax=Cribrihabitans pelagius TaxID=1765746 RepID=UPI003B5C35EE
MTDYEKLNRTRRDLEEIRAGLAARIGQARDSKPDLLVLHERISKAIKALSGQG